MLTNGCILPLPEAGSCVPEQYVCQSTKGAPNFSERRKHEVRLSPGPMGGYFSGSCAVTSRNPLLHDGATNATKSRRSDPEEAPPCHSRVPGAGLGGMLATSNFRELPFPRNRVNKGKRTGRSIYAPALLRCSSSLRWTQPLPC